VTAFALVTGALARAPETKTSKAGKPYVMASIKVAADNAIDYWSVLVFSETAQAELARLGEGDKVSVQGSLKVATYVAKDGETKINRTLFADCVLALRQPPREKKAKAAPALVSDDAPRGTRMADPARVAEFTRKAAAAAPEFGDDIPF
jgi:single-stranded DNA-binding protein